MKYIGIFLAGTVVGSMIALSVLGTRFVIQTYELGRLQKLEVTYLEKENIQCRQDLMGYATDLAVCNYTKERIEK